LIDDEIKISAIIILIISAIMVIYPLVSSNRIVEPFSSMSILNINGLPVFSKSVIVGETINFRIEIGNYESKPEYYKILVKEGDQTSNVTDETPFNAPILQSRERIILNNSNYTMNIGIELLTEGINRRIIFELYKYNSNFDLFTYYGWTQIWMNVTKTS
jgi:uncharacterized membrane protein